MDHPLGLWGHDLGALWLVGALEFYGVCQKPHNWLPFFFKGQYIIWLKSFWCYMNASLMGPLRGAWKKQPDHAGSTPSVPALWSACPNPVLLFWKQQQEAGALPLIRADDCQSGCAIWIKCARKRRPASRSEDQRVRSRRDSDASVGGTSRPLRPASVRPVALLCRGPAEEEAHRSKLCAARDGLGRTDGERIAAVK